jgi:hypothetical protein
VRFPYRTKHQLHIFVIKDFAPYFEGYGFEIVTGTVTEVALSVTVKLTIVPFVPAHAVAAVTVNWPLVVRVAVEIVRRLPFEDAAIL